jgi:two-component system phosphate regulon sensor histidine kinase PhoR
VARSSGDTASKEMELAGLKPRIVLARAGPLAGEPGGVFCVLVDVTEMRRLETLRRDFVANVSHELRTPVTAIRSAAETLQSAMRQDPAAAGMFVDIIDRNAARLHALVEDLLDLSRIESRELELELEPVDLNHLFGQVIDLFRERADKKQIGLTHEVPEDLPMASGDRGALENVLTNLVDNAVKYCGPKSVVTLSAAEDGKFLRVCVCDTGPGIDAAHLPRLFERFYRVDTGRSRELGGTGLGLSIVKHLVEGLGGSVRVASTPGEGTRFSFTVPRSNDEAAKPPSSR